MDSVTEPLLGEACHRTSSDHPEDAQLQIDEHWSPKGNLIEEQQAKVLKAKNLTDCQRAAADGKGTGHPA
ncbi:hypothetical protein NQZ68_003022 [Dissostichus eleginoides]|nr:hypothetical protein NQZ68_003022 [Dissostichus eleginoides]